MLKKNRAQKLSSWFKVFHGLVVQHFENQATYF